MTLMHDAPATTVERPSQVRFMAGSRKDLYRAFLADETHAESLPEVRWGPIGREVYERTYSREIYKRDPDTGEFLRDVAGALVSESWWVWQLPAAGRTSEVWAETVRRVVLGNTGFAPADTLLDDEQVELFAIIYEFGMIPGGRHLWVTGTTNPFSRNCWASGWSGRTSDHSQYLASRLFEGGGVGANYSFDLIAVTHPVVTPLDVRITIREDHPDYEAVKAGAGRMFLSHGPANEAVVMGNAVRALVGSVAQVDGERWLSPTDVCPGGGVFAAVRGLTVADKREGWVDAWCDLIDAATTPHEGDEPVRVLVDLSELRQHGAPLKTFGGRASGPAPLATAIREITTVLNTVVAERRRLSGIETMEIDHEIAASIVAGGARRSARMSMMRWDDPDIFRFIHLKKDTAVHWSTNISVEVDAEFRTALEDESHPMHAHAVKVLDELAKGMARDGEPGMIDTDRLSDGEHTALRVTNPCGEIGLETDPTDAAGESCNLGSVSLDHYGTDTAGALRAFELTARFLVRATLNPYPGEAPNRIEARNRRIGVGLMGVQGWAAEHEVMWSDIPDSPALRNKLHLFRRAVRNAADQLADRLGVPRPVKVTTVPPTGSTSQMPGVTAGIHPVNAKFFIRRVRYVDSDPKLAGLAAKGHTIVDDVYAANTKVVEFYVKDTLVDRYGPELIEQANEIPFEAFMRVVATVQSTYCAGSDGNAVSATAILPADTDPAELSVAIRELLGQVKGITAFPEVSRPLAPIESISEADYNLGVYLLGEEELGDSNDGACATGACPVR